jgi:hypothetical protein
MFGLTSSLEKVFPAHAPKALPEGAVLSALRGDVPAVQLFYAKAPKEDAYSYAQPFTLRVSGAPTPARFRSVELVPSDFPCYEHADDNYLTTEPGLFPDVLRPLPDNRIIPKANQYRAVWIDFPELQGVPAGEYRITVTASADVKFGWASGEVFDVAGADQLTYACHFTLRVLNASLPKQRLIHTEWFHSDGIAQYYGYRVFSEPFWATVERYIEMAGRELGINSLLAPVFTPPLDTAKDGERLTVQLVDVEITDSGYRFNFEKLGRWCGITKRHGVEYLEVPHFFTQWGAEATPKIMALEHGVMKRIFGWDVPATNPRYRGFLKALVPELRKVLEGFGYDRQHVIFHISDEPSQEQIKGYLKAKAEVADLLDGCMVIDALSDYQFYSSGAVEHPVPANDHIQPFLDNDVPGLWVYYCCCQCIDVPNRFYAMPSARNRIMGVLMYLNRIEGFLHWGYNFYNTQFSLGPIDPFKETHAGYAFPSGDPYLVYPGEDGAPLSSIRGEVQREGLDDMRALQLLEQLAGREFVESLIREGRTEPFSFKRYPKDAEYLLSLKEKVCVEIEKRT